MFMITSHWPDYCGGNILHCFSRDPLSGPYIEAPEGTAEDMLKTLDAACEVSCFALADAEGGLAYTELFKRLPGEEGRIAATDDYALCYRISPSIFNLNSGNYCRTLFVWRDYTEEAVEGIREEIRRDEEGEPKEYY